MKIPGIIKLFLKTGGLLLVALAILLLGPAYAVVSGEADLVTSWHERSRESTGLAPDPKLHTDAVVQVYAARAYKWRGAFAVHTWIAVKPRHAEHYAVLDVNAWRHYRGYSSLRMYRTKPDKKWFGSMPEVLVDIRGAAAEKIIPKIVNFSENYKYKDSYTAWPGPNSNTFTAFVGRAIPDLKLDLPSTAVGKDYIGQRILAATPSGSGFQISLRGLLGLLVSREEGIEFNILGLNFGLDPGDLAFRLPGIGSVGLVAR